MINCVQAHVICFCKAASVPCSMPVPHSLYLALSDKPSFLLPAYCMAVQASGLVYVYRSISLGKVPYGSLTFTVNQQLLRYVWAIYGKALSYPPSPAPSPCLLLTPLQPVHPSSIDLLTFPIGGNCKQPPDCRWAVEPLLD